MRTFAQKPKATQQTRSAKSTIPAQGHFGQSPEVRSTLHLQRTIGNQAVQRMFQVDTEQPEVELTEPASPRFGHDYSRIPLHPPAGAIQTKLAINSPGDEYEQEADRVADQVMRIPEPKLQRACACGGTPGRTGECEECEKKRLSLQHMSLNSPVAGDVAPPIVHDVLRSSAPSLDAQTRAFMEPRFGHDFSGVRIHTGNLAARSAEDVEAQAFTFGSDIVFGSGRFAPSTPEGRKLLAHELAHVVQQGAAPAVHSPAEAAGTGIRPVAPGHTDAGPQLRRQAAPGPSSSLAASSPTAGLAPSTISSCRIEFRQGTTDAVDPAARDACLETARAYVEAGGDQVELHGYASEEGAARFNADLARRRAEAAKRLLVARRIPAAAISTIGHGEDRTYPGLAPNRRVEVVLFRSLTFAADKITIPRFICGPDVTRQVEDAVASARSLFAGWTPDQKNEACEDLRGVTTGSAAWDIVELHNNAWILNYRPLGCATLGATPHCGSTVQVGRECYYAGSPNYVIFGTMCRLCYDHFYAQGRAGANVGYTGWIDFTERSMLDLIDLYKRSSDNLVPSKAWAVAGRDGWPSGGSPPSGDRPGCAPQCSQPYTGPAFRVNWYPHAFHTGDPR
jgi:outer membrane protein OmpA-like peptidoglycan-associated protein